MVRRCLNLKVIHSLVALIYLLSYPCYAEIPFEQVRGVFDATKDDQKENSPLWGMVAIHSKVLPHIRFFGPYGSYTKALEQKLPEKQVAKSLQLIGLIKLPPKPSENATKEEKERLKKLKKLYNSYSLAGFNDVPQNYIAALIQLLFSSPDGAIFTATVRHSPQDPLYRLVKDEKGQINLTNMNLLLQAVINLKTAIKQGAKEEISKAEQSIFELFAGKLTEDERKVGNPPYLIKLDQLKFSRENWDKFLSIYFAHILIQAVKEELLDTEVQSLYPKNICITALLSYVWKVANDKTDLKTLTAIMKPEKYLIKNIVVLAVQSYARKTKDLKTLIENKFTPKDYFQYKDTFLKTFQEQKTPVSPEEIALFRIGYSAYEELLPSPISYKHGVKYSGYEGGYPDCGETSLRNFFYYAFNQNGSFSREYFAEFLKKIDLGSQFGSGKIKELQSYFKVFSSTSSGSTQQAHDAWSEEIVSGLDIEGSECPYKFGTKDKCVCNISAARGLFNMLTVIGKLIPDAKLAEPWKTNKEEKFQQMGEKLDRLCALIGRDGFNLDWHIHSEKQITSETGFPLTLTINGKDAFVWDFLPGHFEIRKVTMSSGWPNRIFYSNHNIKNYPLLQAWFTQPNNLTDSQYQQAAQPFLIFGQDLRNNGIMVNVVDYLFDRQYQAYYASAVRWLRPLFQDQHSLNQLKAMMIGHPEQLSLFSEQEQRLLKSKTEEYKTLFFDYIVKYGYLSSLRQLIKQDETIINTTYGYNDSSPLHLAAENGRTETVEMLLKENVDIDVLDRYSNSPLFLAANNGHTETVKLLLKNGANVKVKNYSGFTPLHAAANNGYTEIVDLLLERKKADINAQGYDKITPIHLAASNGHTEVVKLLLDKGATVDARNGDQNTPLHEAAGNGYTETVKLLLERKADINAKNMWNVTPLYRAANNGYLWTVKLLLENGAEVDQDTIKKAKTEEIKQLLLDAKEKNKT